MGVIKDKKIDLKDVSDDVLLWAYKTLIIFKIFDDDYQEIILELKERMKN